MKRDSNKVNGNAPQLTGQQSELVTQEAMRMAMVVVNRVLGTSLGGENIRRQLTQFDGERELYTVLGYTLHPTYDNEFADRYFRQDIAKAIIDKPAEATWRRPPVLIDTDGGVEIRSDAKDKTTLTPFLAAWNAVANRHKVWHFFERADKLASIGRYGVLYLGVRDSNAGITTDSLSMPVGRAGPGSLLFLSPFGEGAAKIVQRETKVNSPRFDLPVMYEINFSAEHDEGSAEGASGIGEVPVHWSRIIHIAPGKLQDNVLGTPELMPVLNLLDDLIKIVGGGSEATWKIMRKGLVWTSQPGFGDSASDALKEDLNQQQLELDMGLRRHINAFGMDVKDLGSQVVDPTGLFKIIISLIAGTKSIPQRLLIGSERGELASNQDEANWAGTVQRRRVNFAEVEIVRPFVNWQVLHKIIPPPTGGDYEVEWPSLFELDELERADVTVKKAQAVKTATEAAVIGGDPSIVEQVRAEVGFAEGTRAGLDEAALLDAEDAMGGLEE